MKILKIAENIYGDTYLRLQLSDAKDISFFNRPNLLRNLLKLPEQFQSLTRSAPPAILKWDNGEISIKSTIGGGIGFYSSPLVTAEEFLTYLHSEGLISSNPFNGDNSTACSKEHEVTATPSH